MYRNVISRTVDTIKTDRGRIWSLQSVTLECGHHVSFEGNDKAIAVNCSQCESAELARKQRGGTVGTLENL